MLVFKLDQSIYSTDLYSLNESHCNMLCDILMGVYNSNEFNKIQRY